MLLRSFCCALGNVKRGFAHRREGSRISGVDRYRLDRRLSSQSADGLNWILAETTQQLGGRQAAYTPLTPPQADAAEGLLTIDFRWMGLLVKVTQFPEIDSFATADHRRVIEALQEMMR